MWRVFRKELLETLRDRRTLVMMIAVPVFFYPLILVIGQQFATFGLGLLERDAARVQVVAAPAEILEILEADSAVAITRVERVDSAALLRGEAEVVLRFNPPAADGQRSVDVFFDGTRDRSRFGSNEVGNILAEWGDTLLSRRLRDRGLSESFAEPVVVRDSTVASAERLGGYALGRFLPMFLILMTMLGAFYPAIDLAAGEKERGTLETLLTTPTPSAELVAGKFLTVTAISLTSAILNLVSMMVTVRFAIFQFGDLLDLTLPVATVFLVMLFLVPMAVFFSALFLGLSFRAESFKEAQNALTPVQLGIVIPIMLPIIPGIPFNYAVAAIPVVGVAMLFRELMAGTAALGPGIVAVASITAVALLSLRFAARSFGREEVLFGTGGAAKPQSWRETLASWRVRPRPTPRPTESIAFVACVGLLYFFLGTVIQLRFGEPGLLVSQILLLAVPALAFAAFGPFDFRTTLALRRPVPRDLLAAAMVILGAMPIGWLLGWIQSMFIELPEEFLRALEDLVRADTPGQLVWLLLLIAITPAICEELVFRGVLLQGLAGRMTRNRAILLSAAIFGAFHLSGETAIRFLPSAWLGVVLALVVWHTRSLFTSMLMHFLSNGLIVLMTFAPAAEGWVLGPEGQPRWSLIAMGLLLLVLGIRLLPDPADQSPPETISSIT